MNSLSTLEKLVRRWEAVCEAVDKTRCVANIQEALLTRIQLPCRYDQLSSDRDTVIRANNTFLNLLI